MKINQVISNVFWYPISSKIKIELYQERIRQLEWDAVKSFISNGSKFLDVGCGSGFNLYKAFYDLGCEVQGIDPSPGLHGVGRYSDKGWKQKPIIKGSAENLPFKNEDFDIVFCSHVLEHVTNQTKSLKEIKRVLKKDGLVIIGMPTASMAIISIISHYLFTTHVNILFFLKNIIKKDVLRRLLHVLIPLSHSYPNHRFVTHDLFAYRIKRWKKIVSKEFEIIETLTPCLYPYPDFIQWFPKRTIKGISSSVFFICKKKC